MRLTRCRLRHYRCLRYGASVELLEPCTLMRHFEITVVKLFLCHFGWFWFFPSSMYYCCKKCDKWGSKSGPWDNETYALPTAPLSLSPLWCISEVIEASTLMRHSGVTLLSGYILCCFWLALVFRLQYIFTVTKSATSKDRTHDLKIMRLTRCLLRHCGRLLYGASVKLLEPCTLMRHSEITVVKLFLCHFWLAPVFRL